ncbi:MAG: OmpA family protein [Bacteroidetes bacterium]|nr:MAG: OmpA family protein [Bacteroidota bacterium]TNE95787.1 MAG: OmpA family protein [Bacteroidota bacterium]
MNKYLTLLLISFHFSGFSQLKQKLADQHFERMEYAKCVEMYDELAAKCLKGKSNLNWENVRRAGIAHFKLYEMNDAIKFFTALQSKNLLTESDREYLIKALRYNEKYGDANNLIRESHNLFPENQFFSTLYDDRDKFNDLTKDSAQITVKETSINSGDGDFGVSFYQNSIIYSSKSKNVGFLNERYGWDDDYFLNMFEARIVNDSVLGEPQLLRDNFVSRAHDGPVSFTPDEKRMVITKNELVKVKGQSVRRLGLYFSEINESGEWGPLYPFSFNQPEYDYGHGQFGDNGNTLYFVSNRPGGFGGTDIYVSYKIGSSWSEPKNLGNLVNTPLNEMFPCIVNNTLYFSSEGHFGLGGLDVFKISLNTSKPPMNLGYPLNTSFDDFNLILDSTENIGYFSSNRGDFIDRVYSYKRNPIRIDLKGNLYELYAEKEPVENHWVYIKNMDRNEIDSLSTGSAGEFDYTLDANNEYRIFTTKEEYILLKEAAVSTNNIFKDTTIHVELLLKPTTILVHLRVIEKKTRNIIPEATVTITDYNKGWDTTLITNQDGIVSLTVDRNVVYWAHGAKKGFIDTDISFNTSNEDGRVIDLELALPPIKKGERFKLENIFYDLNKSTLRPESKSSLDKLADFIIKNDLKIELSAHTDSRGSNTYNQKLSQARAQSCVDYLISKGVRKDRITAKGYGETMLVNKCKDGVQCSEEEHQENRRTEVRILEVN